MKKYTVLFLKLNFYCPFYLYGASTTPPQHPSINNFQLSQNAIAQLKKPQGIFIGAQAFKELHKTKIPGTPITYLGIYHLQNDTLCQRFANRHDLYQLRTTQTTLLPLPPPPTQKIPRKESLSNYSLSTVFEEALPEICTIRVIEVMQHSTGIREERMLNLKLSEILK